MKANVQLNENKIVNKVDGTAWLKEKRALAARREPPSQRVSVFLTQSRPVECEMKSKVLLEDRPSPRLHAEKLQ